MPLLRDRKSNDQLDLRRWSLENLDELLAAIEVNFDELHTWMIWAATMPTRNQLYDTVLKDVALFDNDERWQFFIFERTSRELVGAAGLHRRGVPHELEIGYWIRSDRTGRGYATQAVRLLTAATFNAGPNFPASTSQWMRPITRVPPCRRNSASFDRASTNATS